MVGRKLYCGNLSYNISSSDLEQLFAEFGTVQTAQVIEELIQMAKDFQESMKRHEDLGLNPDEVSFYDALAKNESAVRELGDDILKKIAHELVEKLRKSTTVDWQVRDSVRAKLRNMVRVLLRRYKAVV